MLSTFIRRFSPSPMGITDFFRPKYRHKRRSRCAAEGRQGFDVGRTLPSLSKWPEPTATSAVRRIAKNRKDPRSDRPRGHRRRPRPSAACAIMPGRGGAGRAVVRQPRADDGRRRPAGAAPDGHHQARRINTRSWRSSSTRRLPAIRKRAFRRAARISACALRAREGRCHRRICGLAAGRAHRRWRRAGVPPRRIDTTQKEVGLAAVDKLDDTDRLENVGAEGRRTRACGSVRARSCRRWPRAEKCEAAGPARTDVKRRRRGGGAQLVREVEAVVETFDFDKHGPRRSTKRPPKDVAHRSAEADDSPAYAASRTKRFTKSAERFSGGARRLYEQQAARSTDEAAGGRA